MSSVDFEDAGHKLSKIKLEPGQEEPESESDDESGPSDSGLGSSSSEMGSESDSSSFDEGLTSEGCSLCEADWSTFRVEASITCVSLSAKECTNSPTPLQSHTLRYEIETSKNVSWKQDMLAHYHHDHLTPTDESAWDRLFPRKILKEEIDEFSWNVLYRKIKHLDRYKLEGDFLKDVSIHDVRLDPESLHGQAQQTNLEYLLMLDVDSLMWSFRKTAGLPTPASPYGGWEAADVELRGHFVGHYLSATAHMWASTHNQTLKEKMTSIVSALKECQDQIGTGYLSAFPSSFFDRFEAVQSVWAPYYTIHKIMAGLLDQHTLAGNPQALEMLTWMVEYFYNRVQNVIKTHSIERHWMSLNEEVGGMNDVLYRLYSITGNQKHLLLAHLFDKPCFLGILAMKADDISGFHTNTHIPVVIGAQMGYEVTGDELYKEIGVFFMDIVNSSHSYATGGTSVSEFWSDPKRLGSQLQTENEESCTTYNMLKVSRNLFRWTREISYADYYERALTNGVLSIQRGTEPGVMIYMLPLGHGVSKGKTYHGWGNPFNSFWCCYGTGIESFSKLGDSIYFEESGSVPGLYVIQYISSSLDWKYGKIMLTQKVDDVVSWDQNLQVTITISENEGSGTSNLNLRIPSWTSSSGINALLNGEPLVLPSPGHFLSISRSWKSGDKIKLEFGLGLRTEPIEDDRPDFASLHAILYGPYLLAGLSLGDCEINIGSAETLLDWIIPIPAEYNSHLISLAQEAGNSEFFLSNKNQKLIMTSSPEAGNHSSVHATFRVIFKGSSSSQKSSLPEDMIGQSLMLEPFDFPGMLVAHKGEDEGLTIIDSGSDEVSSAEFKIVEGLDGKNGTVSLESKSTEGCFVYTGAEYEAGQEVTLSCKSESLDSGFAEAASFVLSSGMREYHPVSFVAKGLKRSYVLEPLLSLRDEFYNVYFNITN
ncbi:hypothetical protein Nepgr_013335 [Nepenthes gracilis]|uniref:Uncharacterized protein n=1 Tax=Nepenthes gracilis TaxID=150966 RepID=A0AAD3SJ07_NEPGR|nr:hypothetical protein Nepgr_013335 [Nepenthes gracilis]